MSQPTFFMTGLSRADESALLSQLEQAKPLLEPLWRVVPEAEAKAILIDTDSMYGQMALMKSLGSGKPLIALTAGARADTPYLLRRPFEATALAAVLNTIAAEQGYLVSTAPQVTTAAPATPATPAITAPAAAEPAAMPAPATPEPSIDLLAHYKLERWPVIDRGFPKHFRIATVMLKAPASPGEIADATGASVAEVCEFIVARLASGHAIKT